MKIVREQCDTCGEWVGDDRPDPDWNTHNRLHYVEHVFISTDNLSDMMRIIQEHINSLDADLKAFRSP
jgi:hypothetical protein